MRKLSTSKPAAIILVLLMALISATAGCTVAAGGQTRPVKSPVTEESEHGTEADTMLALPALEAVAIDGRKLRVVATTGIIGDVVAQVGGEAIELKTLIGPGQDPHTYQPGAADLTAAADADVIFVNGWNLEEGLVDDLETISAKALIVPISAGVAPRLLGEEAHAEEETGKEHDHGGVDAHAWESVPNVVIWTDNVEQILSELDPTNAASYQANAAAYRQALAQLDAEVRRMVETIPAERRILVTNHDAYGYFADEYGFRVLGTVIPSISTVAEPSAADLAGLATAMADQGVCAIFTDSTVSDRLAQTIAAELKTCEEVRVVQLYSGALGPPGSDADSYIGMMRANVAAIVEGLR